MTKVVPWTVMTVLGGGWGDEGKAKNALSLVENLTKINVNGLLLEQYPKFIDTDYNNKLPENSTIVVRYNGGSNAGHTNVVPGLKPDELITIKNIQIPCGILVPGTVAIIGPQCLVNIELLKSEILTLEKFGVKDINKRLIISPYAHVVTQDHIRQDEDIEKKRRLAETNYQYENGKQKASEKSIGTTLQGIGPCNAGKMLRLNERVEDYPELEEICVVMDTRKFFELNRSVCLNIVFEGAQSVELDINYGDYPYVTSGGTFQHEIYSTGVYQNVKSNTTVLALKVYETYVGNKKFQPPGDVFKFIAEAGHEKGTRTGRLRQINYLDLSRLTTTIYTATPANGKIIVVFNKYDVLDEVAKKYPEDAFAVIHNNNIQKFTSFADMQIFIIGALGDVGVDSSNIYFTNTPMTTPEMWHF